MSTVHVGYTGMCQKLEYRGKLNKSQYDVVISAKGGPTMSSGHNTLTHG